MNVAMITFMSVFVNQVDAEVRPDGLTCTRMKVKHAERNDWLTPRPKRVAMGRLQVRVFEPHHVDQMAAYIRNPKLIGRGRKRNQFAELDQRENAEGRE